MADIAGETVQNLDGKEETDYFRIPCDEGNKLAFAIMNIQDRLDDLLKAVV
jgi:hypothetical protein